jgi:hypothetical protein
MSDAVGWLATAVFALSYFVRDPAAMRRVQALAAGIWMAYGVLIGSAPVVGANLIVTGLALFSSWRPAISSPPAAAPPSPATPPSAAA